MEHPPDLAKKKNSQIKRRTYAIITIETPILCRLLTSPIPEMGTSYNSQEPTYVHNSGVFDRDTNLDNLERKLHRFTKIYQKPLHILKYFIREFE